MLIFLSIPTGMLLAQDNDCYTIDRSRSEWSQGVDAVNEDDEEESAIKLSVPNPFNDETEIRLNMKKSSKITLQIIDIEGKLVKVLEDGFVKSGNHTFKWDERNEYGKEVSSGTYYCQLITEEKKEIKMISLIK